MSTPAANGDLHGSEPNFHAALEDAYGKRNKGVDPTDYVVAEIRVQGSNPITSYSVVLRRPGR
jgi:hypothetical protein